MEEGVRLYQFNLKIRLPMDRNIIAPFFDSLRQVSGLPSSR